MQHLAGYYSSVDPAGALTLLAAIPDQAIRTDGNDIVVPTDMANLVAEVAFSAATGPSYAQVQSPSLRQLANQDITTIYTAVTGPVRLAMQHHFNNPRSLKGNESVNFALDATGGAAEANYGLIWLSSGPLAPVTGNMFTVRATSAADLAAGTWVNSALTFDSTLPAGTYNVVGMRAIGTNLVAARLVFVGMGYRPGVVAVGAVSSIDHGIFRYGAVGSFGTFDVNQPPTVDCLGDTDTSQVIELDIIKIT